MTPRNRRGRRLVLAVAAIASVALAGCSTIDKNRQNSLEPKGPASGTIDNLFTPVFWVAAVIGVLVIGVTVWVAIRGSSGSRYGNRCSTRRLMPPPHGLFLGNLDRSRRRTVTPARASVRAAVAPAGPAPTTITMGTLANRVIW